MKRICIISTLLILFTISSASAQINVTNQSKIQFAKIKLQTTSTKIYTTNFTFGQTHLTNQTVYQLTGLTPNQSLAVLVDIEPSSMPQANSFLFSEIVVSNPMSRTLVEEPQSMEEIAKKSSNPEAQKWAKSALFKKKVGKNFIVVGSLALLLGGATLLAANDISGGFIAVSLLSASQGFLIGGIVNLSMVSRSKRKALYFNSLPEPSLAKVGL